MTNPIFPVRPFEQALGFDPGQTPDANLSFVWAIRSPWHPGHCPKNLREARTLCGAFAIDLLQPYRAVLLGLAAGQSIIVVTWMGSARRDLIQQHPTHRADPIGTFALRSPIRPDLIGLAVVRWTGELLDEYYDEFVFNTRITDTFAVGSIAYFPTVQECANGAERWIEIPAAGQDPHELKGPAPGVVIVEPGHSH